jgi:hypothetical protein
MLAALHSRPQPAAKTGLKKSDSKGAELADPLEAIGKSHLRLSADAGNHFSQCWRSTASSAHSLRVTEPQTLTPFFV